MRSRHLPFSFSAVLAVLLLSLVAPAQNNTWNGNKINGVPASVTSFGFGGRPGFHGVPPSVTSLNFGQIGQVPNPGSMHLFHGIVNGHGIANGHRHNRLVSPFYANTYYVPYVYPMYVMPGYDSSAYDNPAENSDPSLAERTGPDAAEELRHELESLRSTVRDYRNELRATDKPVPRPEPEQTAASQPRTVLVFKDGRQQNVENYAIVGGTLYDFSEGRTKKVALAELDLAATVKQNDERGVEFRVPAASN